MTKIISLFLALIMLLSILAGCNNKSESTTQTNTKSNTTESTENDNKTENPAEDFVYQEKEDGTLRVGLRIGYVDNNNHVTIPSEIDDKIVTELITECFYLIRNTIRSVTLPDTIIAIGRRAFKDCIMLSEINLPDSLLFIGDSAFENCTSLKQITIPANCFNAFDLGGEYSETGLNAFARSGLETVIFKEGVEIIPNFAFHYCANLESVTLNEGLISIQSGAFSHTKLKEIIIPATVKKVWDSTFAECNSLEAIKFKGDAPEAYLEMPSVPYLGSYTIYYYADAQGFTSPEWYGFSTEIW